MHLLLRLLLISICAGIAAQAAPAAAPGPLRVHPVNPRYFTDDGQRVVYLTGAHTWNNFQAGGSASAPRPLDFSAYLDWLAARDHNFIRLWTWENTRWTPWSDAPTCAGPFPWRRTGPGTALDGGPKFDLDQPDPVFYEQLRARVVAARDRGFYVSVMLFQGVVARKKSVRRDATRGHPYHAANNRNGFDGDRDADHVLDLASPAVRARDADYVRRVIDTLNDLDNVLYEVANEGGDRDWNNFIVRTVREYEATKPKRHPIGLTGRNAEESNDLLFDSDADWISLSGHAPGWIDLWDEPRAADGRKVSLLDTDHIWGEGADSRWVWTSFLRGHQPLYMDRIAEFTGDKRGDIPGAEDSRRAMGATRRLAGRVDLTRLTPRDELASSRVCLARSGDEYLVYVPAGLTATVVDLTGVAGSFSVEWIHPISGAATPAPAVAGGRLRPFTAPFAGDAVLHLTRSSPKSPSP